MMKKYTLYKFYADWCGPCRTLSEILKENKEDFEARYDRLVNFKEVNVDEDDALCIRYKIKSIPAMVLVENEKSLMQNTDVWRHIGSISYKELCNKLDEVLSNDLVGDLR